MGPPSHIPLLFLLPFFARPIRRAKEEEEEEKEGTSYVTLLSCEPSCWLQHFPSSKDLFLFMVMHLKYHTIFAFRLPADLVSPFFPCSFFPPSVYAVPRSLFHLSLPFPSTADELWATDMATRGGRKDGRREDAEDGG